MIELTSLEGEPILVRVNSIISVLGRGDCHSSQTTICTIPINFGVSETYEEVVKKMGVSPV